LAIVNENRPPRAPAPRAAGTGAADHFVSGAPHGFAAWSRRPALLALVMVGCGVLYGICFPPFGVRPLAWVALVPFLVVLPTVGLGRTAWLGAIVALAATCTTVDWLPRTVATYYAQPVAVGLGMFVGVALLMVVPPVVGFMVCYRLFVDRYRDLLPLVAAASFVSTELVRARFLTGNPWVIFGYSQVGADRVVQIADLGGVYAVSFVLVAVNVALADVVRRGALRVLVVPALLLAATLAYGQFRLAGAGAPVAGPRVAVVQANLDSGTQWRRELYGENLEAHLRLTDRAAREGARLVVWPENAMTFFVEREPLYREAIARVLAPRGVQLVAGGPRVVEDANPTYYDSAFVISPAGAIEGRYDKEHLLPFAEYFPLPELDFLRRSFGRVRELTPGGPTPPLPTIAGPAGVLICNEAMFPEVARARVRAGAAVLLNLTNDTWMNDAKYSAIAFDMIVLRAVEQRRFLVRASTAGPSAIVDPLGHVLVRTDLSTAGLAAAAVAPRTEQTPYARIGDAFAFACVAVTVVALARRLRA
jgi:apolipoprotein N-acyltransferase